MAKDIKDALPTGTLLTSSKRTYRIEEVLGAGGFGITYRVSSEIMVDNVPVVTYFALKEHFVRKACERKDSKVCSTSNNSSDVEKSRENFISEAKRLNKLSASHNNIVKVNENFSANDTAYYVMEYIDGPSLRTVIKENGNKPLTWEEAVKIIKPIANAVSYLHENRLTHLDIKPDNIILDSKKGNRPVLIDFGLSKHYDKKGEATSTIRVTGCSDGYSPIEQYVGITTFSPKADVYSLAATLLFLLTGNDPVIATELSEGKIRESLEGKVPSYAINGIVNALKRQSEDRTVSIRAFMESIETPDKPSSDRIEHNNQQLTRPADDVTVKLERKKREKKDIKKIASIIGGVVVLLLIGYGIYSLVNRETYEKLPDGSKFFGKLDEDGKPDGEGRLEDTFGRQFIGTWRNGDFEFGIVKTAEFEYEGDLQNLIPSGYGTAIYSDGRVYVGNWNNGDWNGIGRLTTPNGNISFGMFKNNVLTNLQPFNVGEICYGIDVSKYQRQIDWENLYLPANDEGKVSLEGGDYMQPAFYALIKATDGKDSDDFYERNYQNAKRCGIVCGAYHFLTAKSSADEQVQKFIEISHLVAGDLPPILDLELPNDVMKNNRKEICEMAIEWLEKVEAHYGVKPLIYTYYSFIKDYLTDPRFDKYEYFIAYHRPKLPYVKNWVFWQFSDKIRIPAISENSVDMDVFNGTHDEFMKYLKRNGIKQPSTDGDTK